VLTRGCEDLCLHIVRRPADLVKSAGALLRLSQSWLRKQKGVDPVRTQGLFTASFEARDGRYRGGSTCHQNGPRL
jgi:hypothetical protein